MSTVVDDRCARRLAAAQVFDPTPDRDATELRHSCATLARVQGDLETDGPFDAHGTHAFLAVRAVPGCEEAAGHTLRRAVLLPGGPAVLELELHDRGACVRTTAEGGDAAAALALARRLLALDADAAGAAAALGADPHLGPLVRAAPGRRLPGCASGAELAVRAVLGQQVTVAAARTLATRLVARHGTPVPGSDLRCFPTPDQLLAGMADDEPAMPGARRRALRAVLEALSDGTLDLAGGADPDAARRALVALPGIGPWTAEYVVARALGDPDAWPPKDVGLRAALARLGLDETAAEAWRPWRTFAMAHLWASPRP